MRTLALAAVVLLPLTGCAAAQTTQGAAFSLLRLDLYHSTIERPQAAETGEYRQSSPHVDTRLRIDGVAPSRPPPGYQGQTWPPR